MSSVLERVGLGLAPLDEEMAEIAHRSMAGHMYRMESCLAMLANMTGNVMRSRLHLSRALQSATLIDDRNAEMLATNQLGMLALVRKNWDRAAVLFETADRQAQTINNQRLTYLVCAGMARFLNNEEKTAMKHLSAAQTIVANDSVQAAKDLFGLGKNMLAMDEAGLAIEVLDEAMECAIEAKDEQLTEQLAEYLVLANNALTESDTQQYLGLRKYLDDINTIESGTSEEFEEKITEIEQQAEAMSKPLESVVEQWTPVSEVLPPTDKFTVLRREVDDDGRTLIIGQHSELGVVGFWLPEGEFNASSGQNITIEETQVKVVSPPESLQTKHSISALIALKDAGKISFSADIEL